MMVSRSLYAFIFLASGLHCAMCKELAEVGGSYYGNQTLLWMNGPFKATKPIVVHPAANLTIQEGVEIQFDPGIGIIVQGSLHAVGFPNFRIRFVPKQMSPELAIKDGLFPNFRLVDGSSTKQGRLQVLVRQRWRSVCTMNTNWTDTDFAVACRTVGFSSGGFYKWFRRNNDTFPFVMPRPRCQPGDESLYQCEGFLSESRIPLAENLCQGEDDVGVWCWGPPTFPGWQNHWMGIQFLDAPRELIFDDPHGVAVTRRSTSKLEWVDILHAGWDRELKNSTSGIYVHGTPPLINYVNVMYSAGDGIRTFEADGPLEVYNSTISFNRGHGIFVDNCTDGRVFVNDSRIQGNWGDGIHYAMKLDVLYPSALDGVQDQISYFEDRPEFNFCYVYHDPYPRRYYPRFIEAFLANGTVLTTDNSWPCHIRLEVAENRPYTFTIQFLEVTNLNPVAAGTKTFLYLCERGAECQTPKLIIPIFDGILPPSVATQNNGYGLWLGLRHENASSNKVAGNIRVLLRVYAQVKDQIMYGLNVSNSRITDNIGNGIFVRNLRDRTIINNVTISNNQHTAGLHILGGSGDIWVNWTTIRDNWGDGINVSYVGGSVFINGTIISNNRWRGAAFHYNSSFAFLPLQQQIVFRGRQANSDFLPTSVSNNGWGGILVGNFCANEYYQIADPRVSISFVSLIGNQYHPAFEFHSCQRNNQSQTVVEVVGCECSRSQAMCIRIQPAVNIKFTLRTTKFFENRRPTLLIRNREHPQLQHLPAEASIEFNEWSKNNVDQFVANVGLNEQSQVQRLILDQQNHFRNNRVQNPYPSMNPRNRPFAVLVVSSSNVEIHQTCFDNPESPYELATDLDEHSKIINSERNSWGGSSKDPKDVLTKIFDARKRYNLASLDVDPYLRYCNFLSNDKITPMLGYFLPWRWDGGEIGGQIVERSFLQKGRYRVIDDLHILPGASLDVDPGTVLEFEDGIGMLVQGELRRGGSSIDSEPILFTAAQFKLPSTDNIRIAKDAAESEGGVLSGRLEVFIEGEWGTVCNRSWNLNLAAKACNQLGMLIDSEFLENWWTFPPPGNLPIVMDIIRCEELETDITKCRHDGPLHNVNVSCRPIDVVGIRCMPTRWSGVRYSLLANPPITTGQEYIHHLIIENAGLFDYAKPVYCAALQIDWNYHTFRGLVIRDNIYTGMDILYNDLARKPRIIESKFLRNRRNGLQARSYGLTLEQVEILDNENAGFRYTPLVTSKLQNDVVSWLDTANLAFNNIISIPNTTVDTLTLESGDQSSGRKFLVARNTDFCGTTVDKPCIYDLNVFATNIQNTQMARICIQIVNRPSNMSDEDIIFIDGDKVRGKTWSLRQDLIRFPIVTQYNQLTVQYRKTFGPASVVVLLFFMDTYQYLDPFIHMRYSVISGNQYGVSSTHYSSFSQSDGSTSNRFEKEQFWFQRTNFSSNRQTVVWVQSPLSDADNNAPVSQIEYFFDNCSITHNNGSIIETHRDLHSSANVFKWRLWLCNFYYNSNSGISLTLPDTQDKFAQAVHRFELMECNFQDNTDFGIDLDGYFAWTNVSANNFTHNRARVDQSLLRIGGMEKQLIFERNRFLWNHARHVILVDIQSQAVRMERVPARIMFNVVDQNYYLSTESLHVDNFPRSFAFGLLGVQKINLTFNYFRNPLIDFEAVFGLRGSQVTDSTNASFNYWGVSTGVEVSQRIFDFDDWNIYSICDFNPFFVNDVIDVVSWWWLPERAQTDNFYANSPSVFDLKGRLFDSITLERRREKWTTFPFFYKPDKPYIIRRDLTIMPGATLTIEKGVEVHLYPNVRILVLGSLIAEGTYYEPIRFLPINLTEALNSDPGVLSPNQQLRNAAATVPPPALFRSAFVPNRQQRHRRDLVYRKFPQLHREDAFYQTFTSFLIGGTSARNGFLEIWNATTGEMVPICDRQFSVRNAQVVCRELGYETNENAYVWIGPRWERDPRLHIVKFYSEPRQCFGYEKKLSDCDIRVNRQRDVWLCVNAEHFVFIHCGASTLLSSDFVGPWGGITFSATSFDQAQTASQKASSLRYVEIVGAGYAHNESGSALELIYQTPTLDHVNITNSSFHAITVLAPRGSVNLNRVNVTNNRGIGANLITLNLQRPSDTASPLLNITFPYHIFGMTEMCSVGKEVVVENRVLVFFKYDNFRVDCIKIFRSRDAGQKIGWKFLHANLYNSGNDEATGRQDWLRFYNSDKFNAASEIGYVQYDSATLSATKESSNGVLGVYFRANAADLVYGFIAEVVVMPFPLDTGVAQEVNILESRFEYNERGAVRYASVGEQNPNFVMDTCYVGHNGMNVWGNFSTTEHAVTLDLHNTQTLKIYGSLFWRNQGGLRIRAGSSTSIARLEGVIRNSAFSRNEVFEALRLEGRDYQKLFIMNSYFGKNWAPYRDTVHVSRMVTNFTHNIFYNNTGQHIVDLTGYSRQLSEVQTFLNNYLFDNIAYGHGYQFNESFGYIPNYWRVFSPRSKRQLKPLGGAESNRETSFEWWAHVGAAADRYRSTILVGSNQQRFEQNYFVNPMNDFELATSNRTTTDGSQSEVDARNNYWGYPATASVAAGRIRDKEDLSLLLPVNYVPVLESNATLLESDCPPGWFQAGQEEPTRIKACFLFIGGAMPYSSAIQFCRDNDAYMPYFRNQDPRLERVAESLGELNRRFMTPFERYYSPLTGNNKEARIWISGVMVPPEQCGFLSSASGKVGSYNCEYLLPFICEKDPDIIKDPFYLRPVGIIGIGLALLAIFAFGTIGTCYCLKSRRRSQEHMERKDSLRDSKRKAQEFELQLNNKKQQQQQPPPRPPQQPRLLVHQFKPQVIPLITSRAEQVSPDRIKQGLETILQSGDRSARQTAAKSKCSTISITASTETATAGTSLAASSHSVASSLCSHSISSPKHRSVVRTDRSAGSGSKLSESAYVSETSDYATTLTSNPEQRKISKDNVAKFSNIAEHKKRFDVDFTPTTSCSSFLGKSSYTATAPQSKQERPALDETTVVLRKSQPATANRCTLADKSMSSTSDPRSSATQSSNDRQSSCSESRTTSYTSTGLTSRSESSGLLPSTRSSGPYSQQEQSASASTSALTTSSITSINGEDSSVSRQAIQQLAKHSTEPLSRGDIPQVGSRSRQPYFPVDRPPDVSSDSLAEEDVRDYSQGTLSPPQLSGINDCTTRQLLSTSMKSREQQRRPPELPPRRLRNRSKDAAEELSGRTGKEDAAAHSGDLRLHANVRNPLESSFGSVSISSSSNSASAKIKSTLPLETAM